jgi:hypothetical protein
MPGFNELYKDSRFAGVSDSTKTDIISTIGIDVNEAKQDVAESKFTQLELTQALHYLLATQAQENEDVARLLVVKENPNPSSSSIPDPFYFHNDDPFLWYWVGYNSGHSHHHGGSIFGGGGGGGGNSNCGDGEGVALVIAAACVCAAGCCCVFCMKATVEGPESTAVKTAKVSASTLTGAAVFAILTYFLIKNDIWRSSLVDDHNWDVAGYRTFQVLMAAFSGLLASGAVSTVNNIFQCLPEPHRDIPKPPARILEALKDLQTVKELLSKGWSRPGDNQEQCDEFIRATVLAYINEIAAAPKAEVRIDIQASPSSSRLTTFGRPNSSAILPPPSYGLQQPLLQGNAPSAPPGGAAILADNVVQLPVPSAPQKEGYVVLLGNEGDSPRATRKSL